MGRLVFSVSQSGLLKDAFHKERRVRERIEWVGGANAIRLRQGGERNDG